MTTQDPETVVPETETPVEADSAKEAEAPETTPEEEAKPEAQPEA